MTPISALWTHWFATSLWPIVGGQGSALITPALMVLISCVVAMFYYAPWLTKNKMWGALFDKKIRWHLLILGLFGTALPFTCMFIALKYTTPANTAILNQVEILYSLVFAYFLLKERPSLQQLIASALVIAGGVIILINEKFSPRLTGDLIVLFTPWMFQLSHVAAKKLPKDLPYFFISAARTFYAGLCMVPIVILFGFFGGALQFTNTARTYLVLAFLGLIHYGAAQPLWYKAIRNMDLSKATAIVLSYPVMTLIISALFGIEKIHMYQTAGLALAFGGAYWITMIVKKDKNGAEK